MRLSTTVLMILAVLVLGVAIIGIDRFVPASSQSLKQRSAPGGFDVARADAIELAIKGGRMTLKKVDGSWMVRQPFEDFADPDLVDKLLSGLHAAEPLESIEQRELGRAWSKTGLDEAAVQVRVMGSGAVLTEWRIGSSTPIDGTVYAAVGTGGAAHRHYVMRSEAVPLLQRQPQEWRDPRLARFPLRSVVGLRLSDGTGQIEIVRDDSISGWKLRKPLQTRASDERVEGLLSTLLNLNITAASARLPEVAGTGQTASDGSGLVVGIELVGAKSPLEIRLRKPASGQQVTECTVSNRKPAFTVSSDTLEGLWVQPNDVRDDRLARIDREAVREIRLVSLAYAEVVLEKKEQSWFLQRHGQVEPANGDRVDTLLDALSTHRIREFAADSASDLGAYGLAKPLLILSWTTADNQTSRLLFGHDGQDSVFAKYENEPFVYRIAAGLLTAFPADGVKWKGLNPVRFSLFALRRISYSAGASPPIILDYNPDTAEWKGTLAGKDIASAIDRVKADALAGALAKFQVQDWAQDRTEALKRLAAPDISVQVSLGEPGNPAAAIRTITLNFSSTQPGMETAIYYGQVAGEPDVFFVSREHLRKVFGSILKKQG